MVPGVKKVSGSVVARIVQMQEARKSRTALFSVSPCLKPSEWVELSRKQRISMEIREINPNYVTILHC